MTDAEIIRHLAEKVMGWAATHVTPQGAQWFDCGDGARRAYWDGCPGGGSGKFNPLESIADAFEAQAAVLAGKNAHRYLLRMNDLAYNGAGMIGTDKLCRVCLSATPRQRCLAMVAATSF